MNQERPTKEILLSNGDKLVLHAFITGRDKRDIEAVMYKDLEMKAKGQGKDAEVEMSGFRGAMLQAAEDATFKAVVKEAHIAGLASPTTDPATILNFILDLPVGDYDKVKEAVEEISAPKKAPTT